MPDTTAKRHGPIALKMLTAAIAMFGFGYAMVPLYDIICEVTGLNGKTGRVSVSAAAATQKDADREIIVEFTASVNQGGSWEFVPATKQMVVTPGETYQTHYYAKNLTDTFIVSQATPSVTPFAAARYFNKTECFCFTRQDFEPNSGREMPLTFIIDPDVPLNVDRVTLSYTLFKSPNQPTAQSAVADENIES